MAWSGEGEGERRCGGVAKTEGGWRRGARGGNERNNNEKEQHIPFDYGVRDALLRVMRVLPLLMAENSERLLKDEVLNNNCMQVNSMTSRSRFIKEFKLRYDSVPAEFWQNFLTLNEEGRRMGLLYVLLRTYELVRYFHFSITIRRWNSVERTLKKSDILMEFSELSAKDETVDGWTAKTKDRCADHYLTVLRQVGMLDPKTNELQSLHSDPVNYEYYFRTGEDWFLEACLLYPYEIEKLKSECQI